MGKVYVIISGKGGVGKTTSAINLGASINSDGKEVLIVDANLTTPNVGLHLGSPIVPISLNHVLNNKAKPEEAIYEHDSGTRIMPASLSINELKKIDYNKLAYVAKKLRKLSEIIIMDSAAGLGKEAKAAIKSADEVIIITNPEISAVTDALKTIKLVEQMDKNIRGCIVTRREGKKWEMNIENIKDMLEVPILGIIPEDSAVKESQSLKNAVVYTHPRSKASRAYRKIGKRLIGAEFIDNQEEQAKKKRGFWARLFGLR